MILSILLFLISVEGNVIKLGQHEYQTLLLAKKLQDLQPNCGEGVHKGVSYKIINTSGRKINLLLDFYNNPPNEVHATLSSNNQCLVISDSNKQKSQIKHILQSKQQVILNLYSTKDNKDSNVKVVLRLRSKPLLAKLTENKGIQCKNAVKLTRNTVYNGLKEKWYRIPVKKGQERIISTCYSYTHMPVSFELYNACDGEQITTNSYKCSNGNGKSIHFVPQNNGFVYLLVTPQPKQMKNYKKVKNNKIFMRYMIGSYTTRYSPSFTQCNKAKRIARSFSQDTLQLKKFKISKGCSNEESRSAYYRVLVPRRQSVQVNTCTWKTTGHSHIEVMDKCQGTCEKVKYMKCRTGNERVIIQGGNKARWVIVRVSEKDKDMEGEIFVQFNRLGRRLFRRRFIRGRPWWAFRLLRRRSINRRRLFNRKIRRMTDKQREAFSKSIDKKIIAFQPLRLKNTEEPVGTEYVKTVANKTNMIVIGLLGLCGVGLISLTVIVAVFNIFKRKPVAEYTPF